MVTVLTMTAGTIFLMWIGEQIDEYGIGNGISLIIMAGIVARIPEATLNMATVLKMSAMPPVPLLFSSHFCISCKLTIGNCT